MSDQGAIHWSELITGDVEGVGRIAMIRDPSGATVGLITPAQQG